VIALVALVALAMAQRQSDGTLPRAVVYAAGAVVVVTGLATLTSNDVTLSLLGDTTRMTGFATAVLLAGALVVGAAAGHGGWRAITNALLAGAGVVTAIGLGQMAGIGAHTGRPTATLGNAVFLGAFLCLVIPSAVGRVLGDPASRRWAVPLLLASGVLLVGTESRGAWVGALVGTAVTLWPWMPARRRLFLGVGFVVVAALAVAFAPSHGDAGAPDTAQGRLDSWAISAGAVTDRPVLGWGPEQMRVAFGRHLDEAFVRDYGLRQIPDRAHNRFLDVAASTGILGLAADIALIAIAGIAIARAARFIEDRGERLCVIGVGAGLLAWLVQGQFLFDTFDLGALAWMIAGALLAAAPPARSVRVRDLAGWLVVPVAGVAWIGALNLVADRQVHSASGRQPADAVARLADAMHTRPRSLDAHLLAAAVARSSRDPILLDAVHQRLKDWRDDDVVLADARVLETLGVVTRDQSRLDAAARSLRRLLVLRPFDVRVIDALAHVERAKL